VRRGELDRVIDVFNAHVVGYFLYIGGNDLMDAANSQSRGPCTERNSLLNKDLVRRTLLNAVLRNERGIWQ